MSFTFWRTAWYILLAIYEYYGYVLIYEFSREKINNHIKFCPYNTCLYVHRNSSGSSMEIERIPSQICEAHTHSYILFGKDTYQHLSLHN